MGSGGVDSGGLSKRDEFEEAALQTFYERGYQGASIRAIASRTGNAVATLFHYFPSKQSILEQIVNGAANQMQAEIDQALAGIEDPVERLAAAIRTMVIASCVRQREVFVAQSEFRSLSPEAFRVNREKRRRIQSTFADLVEAGIAAGEFDGEQPNGVARSLVLLSSTVANWYEPGHGLTVEEIADSHVEMAMRLVGCRREGVGTGPRDRSPSAA
jgi:AcrR family transcriptional regulator